MAKMSDILDALGAYEDDKRDTGWRAACPAHEKDREHSGDSLIVDVNEDASRVLLFCESRQCDLDDILVGAGLSRRDLMEPTYVGQSARRKTGAARKAPATSDARRSLAGEAYRYAVNLAKAVEGAPEGAEATLLATSYGVDPAGLDSAKADALGIGLDDNGWLTVTARTAHGAVAFMQRRDPDPDAEVRWLGERNPDEVTRWDAAGFVGEVKGDRPVLVVEGMSDAVTVAALETYDVVAIRGAALGARVAEVADALAGREVYVLADADEAGARMREAVLGALASVAGTLKSVDWPDGTPKGGDVKDFRALEPETFSARLAALLEAAEDADEAEVDFDPRPYLGGTNADQGRAILEYARLKGCSLAWTPSHGWLVYDGSVWLSRAEARVWQMSMALGDIVREKARKAAEKAEKSGKDKHERRAKALNTLAYNLLTTPRIEAALKALSVHPDVYSSADDFDANHDLLGVANGVVDLRTGELRPMTREDRITRRLSIAYRPEAKAERWERFLEEVLVGEDCKTTDPELVDYVQALVGYGATGHTSEHLYVILNGAGANGKSQLTTVISEVFAECTNTTPFSTFESRSGGGGIPNDLAMLKGARFVIASESNANAKMDEALLKRVTGEDVITARFMRQEFFEFRPTFLLMMATNHKPRFISQDHGIWRRTRLIEFRRQFARHEWEVGLAERIVETEAEGVLAWAVRGAMAWYANGKALPPCKAVEEASEGYKQDEDVLRDFLLENIEEGDEYDRVFHGDLYQRYTRWASETGSIYVGSKTFTKMLDERWGPRIRQATPAQHRGRRLRTIEEVARYRIAARLSVDPRDVHPKDVNDELLKIQYPEAPRYATKHGARVRSVS